MKNLMVLFGVLSLMLLGMVSAEQCNETWRPCVVDECTSTDMTSMFLGVTNFDTTIGDITGWNTSCVTIMHNMFAGSDFNQDIGSWDTSSVTDMSLMFVDASNFNQDISGWDVSKVQNMAEMFSASGFNQSLSAWDISSLVDTHFMFSDGIFNNDLSGWNTRLLNNMANMFKNSPFNQDISSWDTGSATIMDEMFSNSPFNQDISGWNTSSLLSMNSMFAGNTVFNQDIGSWDVSKVQSMTYVFEDCAEFNQDIGSWDTGSVTSMEGMFSFSGFDQDISGWDVSKVENMFNMFYTTAFNQNISSWDVSSVTNMNSMFYESIYFNQDISSWDVSSVTNMDYMFENSSFNQDIGSWDVSSVASMQGMFYGTPFNQDISSWDVGLVTYMNSIFAYSSFDQDIGSWNITSVLDMENMFAGSNLSTSNYDSLLNGWASCDCAPAGLTFDGGFSTYSINGNESRTILDNDYMWTITDGGMEEVPCANSLVNTTASAWVNISCLVSDLMNQSRSYTTYDENNCGNYTNITFYEYRATLPCDYCVENWSPHFTNCTIADNHTLYWTDSNNCGTYEDLPAQNGTVSSCNYCSGVYTTTTQNCLKNYNWVNYNTCCGVTHLESDCTIPANVSSCVGVHTSSEISSVVIDFFVEYGMTMIGFIGVIALFGLGVWAVKSFKR